MQGTSAFRHFITPVHPLITTPSLHSLAVLVVRNSLFPSLRLSAVVTMLVQSRSGGVLSLQVLPFWDAWPMCPSPMRRTSSVSLARGPLSHLCAIRPLELVGGRRSTFLVALTPQCPAGLAEISLDTDGVALVSGKPWCGHRTSSRSGIRPFADRYTYIPSSVSLWPQPGLEQRAWLQFSARFSRHSRCSGPDVLYRSARGIAGSQRGPRPGQVRIWQNHRNAYFAGPSWCSPGCLPA